MCGILGLFNFNQQLSPDVQALVGGMLSSLAHRGPDGQDAATLWGGRCILGHTRLSIIDIEGGHQPLANEDGSIWVSFNGEIYNYVELRQDLQVKGHQFKTASDTEVLVHLYEEYGIGFLYYLVGMFAFALLDQKRGCLIIARDRMGEKPLYYTRLRDGTWGFSSEMKALSMLPGVDQDLDWVGIAQYLALGYIPSPRTLIRNIKKLLPANYIIIDSQSVAAPRRYWNPTGEPRDNRSLPELTEALNDHLAEAVKLQLRSDVPLGAFLSGGVDSALVCASITQQIPASSLQTFCIGFDDPRLDESALAAETAKALGSSHHTLRVSAGDMYKHLEELICHYDEPLGDVSMLPTWVVCREARKHVKVILSGDGGDECFGGYHHYYAYRNFHGLRNFPGLNHLSHYILANVGNRYFRGRGLVEFFGKTDAALLFSEFGWIFSSVLLGKHYSDEFKQARLEWNNRLEPLVKLPYPASAMRSDLLEGYLPEQILVKVDRASMFAGLESRAPFLDHRVVEFAMSISPKQHFGKGIGKLIPRLALPELIPENVRWGHKRGFTPPWATWIRGPLKTILADSIINRSQSLEGVNVDLLYTLLDQHCQGEDNADLLFRWFALERTVGNILRQLAAI